MPNSPEWLIGGATTLLNTPLSDKGSPCEGNSPKYSPHRENAYKALDKMDILPKFTLKALDKMDLKNIP